MKIVHNHKGVGYREMIPIAASEKDSVLKYSCRTCLDEILLQLEGDEKSKVNFRKLDKSLLPVKEFPSIEG